MFSKLFQIQVSQHLTPQERSLLHRVVAEIEGWISPLVAECLYYLAKTQGPHGDIVEIGSWQGKSTICLALGLKKANSSYQVIAIDPHTGSKEHQSKIPIDTFPLFIKNIELFGVSSQATPQRTTSQEAALKSSSNISMLWIDGSHEYLDVLEDFQKWFTLLQPGGVIAFHDSNWPGVRQVLWEELYTHPLVGIVRRIEQTTFARKLHRPNKFYSLLNFASLKFEMKRQVFKGKLRKWRKRRKRAKI